MKKRTTPRRKVTIVSLIVLFFSMQEALSQDQLKCGTQLLYFVTKDYKGLVQIDIDYNWDYSLADLNPSNPQYPPWPTQFGEFNLDSLFTDSQILVLERQMKKSPNFEAKDLSKELSMSKRKNSRENVFITISFPLISEGTGDCTYGIIKVSRVFEGEGETSFKYYRKCGETWEFLHSHLLSFS